MRAKLLNENGERVFAVIFETGDDPVTGLTRFAEEQNLRFRVHRHRRVQ